MNSHEHSIKIVSEQNFSFKIFHTKSYHMISEDLEYNVSHMEHCHDTYGAFV